MRKFVKDAGHADRYHALTVNYIDHHNPDLVLFDAHGDEVHRIDLTRLKTTENIHRLLTMLGMRERCRDADASCANWASGGECERNQDFMHASCRLACKLCSDGGGGGGDDDWVEVCANAHGNDGECEYWSTMGECDTNAAFMHASCARSCGICTSAPLWTEEEEEDDEEDDGPRKDEL